MVRAVARRPRLRRTRARRRQSLGDLTSLQFEALRHAFPAVVRALGRLGEADRTELLQGLFRMTDRARDELLENLATESAILEQVRRSRCAIRRDVHDR